MLIDVLTEDAARGQWLREALALAGDDGRLVIKPIIYAEISIGFDRIGGLDDSIWAGDFE